MQFDQKGSFDSMKESHDLKVRLFGGLGNQLFQYFAGMYLSSNTGSRLKIDVRWIDSSYSQGESDIRDFRFLKEAAIINTFDSGELNFKLERLKTKISEKSQTAANLFSLYVPNNPGFIEFSNLKPGVELRGYFQTYKYFQNVLENDNVQDWSLKNVSRHYLESRSHLDSAPFIAIHVRGGDYLNKAHIHHKLEKEYYFESLKYLQGELGDIKLLVFSDDVDYARYLLNSDIEFEFINQHGLRASEAMILMSLGKGIITANSTFSYWAAMINAGNQICAPKFWYTNTVANEYLYPQHWKLI
jgi:hypothetical protein